MFCLSLMFQCCWLGSWFATAVLKGLLL